MFRSSGDLHRKALSYVIKSQESLNGAPIPYISSVTSSIILIQTPFKYIINTASDNATLAKHNWLQLLNQQHLTLTLANKVICCYSTLQSHSTRCPADNCWIHWTTLEQWPTIRHQRVLVNGVSSSAIPMRSGVPQGTVLGPLMFLVNINNIGKKTQIRICMV